jgi:hypothetical protein
VKEKPSAEDLVNRMENDIHTYPLWTVYALSDNV